MLYKGGGGGGGGGVRDTVEADDKLYSGGAGCGVHRALLFDFPLIRIHGDRAVCCSFQKQTP